MGTFTSPIAAAALALLAISTPLRAAGLSRIVPGRMGPNALPAIAVEDAALPEAIVTEVGGALHLDGGAADRAITPRFRLVVPFHGSAAFEVEGTPVEFWSVSPATRARTGGVGTSGVAKGDVSFGARFAIFREREGVPAVALRILTKSTTGKGLEDLRFTDAPAYAIEALASKTVHEGPALVRSVRVLAKLGFLAWSQDQGVQDDAIDYGAAVDTALRTGTVLRLEVRGYAGYQAYDKPMLASVRVLQQAWSTAAISLGVNRGLTPDAPDWELRAGMVFTLRTPFR